MTICGVHDIMFLLKFGSWVEFSIIFMLATLTVIMALVIDTENILWKTACFVHVIVVLAGAFYMSIVVIQLLLQHMKNPLRYEEGRYVTRFISERELRYMLSLVRPSVVCL